MKRKSKSPLYPVLRTAAVLLGLYTAGTPAGQGSGPAPTPFLSLRIRNNLVTLQARGADRMEVVRRLADEAGLELKLYESPSGRISAAKKNPREAEITIRDKEGKLSRKVALPLDHLASVVLLGEDRQGRLLLQVEQFHPDRPGVDLKVLKVNLSGKIVAETGKIENNYMNWTARLLRVDSRGDLYQMLPGPEAVELNRWQWKE